jgi:hypothetical protein
MARALQRFQGWCIVRGKKKEVQIPHFVRDENMKAESATLAARINWQPGKLHQEGVAHEGVYLV